MDADIHPDPRSASRSIRSWLRTGLTSRWLMLSAVAVALLLAVLWLAIGLGDLGRALTAGLDAVLDTRTRPAGRDLALAAALAGGEALLWGMLFLALAHGLHELFIGPVMATTRHRWQARRLRCRSATRLGRRVWRLALLALLLRLVGLGIAGDAALSITQAVLVAGTLLFIGLALALARWREGLSLTLATCEGPGPLAQLLLRVPLYTALGIVALVANPFGISDRADQASQDAFYRVIAPFYDRPAREAGTASRDDILVVLLDENGISQLHQRRVIVANEWPILYQDHGAILERILAYQPRALFVDVFFKRERSTDDTLQRTLERLQRAKPEGFEGLMFAGGFPDERLTPMRDKLAAVGRLPTTGWQGYAGGYPLRENGRSTAALELYRVACPGKGNDLPGCHATAPMVVDEHDALSVRWGSAPAAPALSEYVLRSCDQTPATLSGALGDMATRVASGLVGADAGDRRDRCPYHKTVFAHDLMAVARQQNDDARQRLKALIEDKIVLYGVTLSGLHDEVNSPVHGLLPGVMLHAMALDNLMVYGGGYTRAGDDGIAWSNMIAWFTVVLLLCGVLALVEIGETRREAVCERRRRHSRRFIYLVGVVIVLGLAGVSFWLFNHEPVNAIGFLAVGALVGQLVHGDLSGTLIRAARCLRDAARNGGGRRAVATCLQSEQRGGNRDGKNMEG